MTQSWLWDNQIAVKKNEQKDSVTCYICWHVHLHHMLPDMKIDDAFTESQESQLINIHAKRLFTENDEQNKTKAIRVFSVKQWTGRCGALVSIIQHCKELKKLWKWCLKKYKDTETKACIIGVQTQINKFNYFFWNQISYSFTVK